MNKPRAAKVGRAKAAAAAKRKQPAKPRFTEPVSREVAARIEGLPEDMVLVNLPPSEERVKAVPFRVGSSTKKGNDEFDRAVGHRLTRARQLTGLTASSAAEQLMISQQALYKYESGERTVKAKTLYDAARLYGVDGDWLLCLTDDLKVTRKDAHGRSVTVKYRGVDGLK